MRPSYCAKCDGALDPVLPDCPHCGAHVDEDRDDHHDEELHVERRAGGKQVEVGRKWKLHVPWGLFIVLGLYGAAADAYVEYSDRTSPQAVAAQHLAYAEQILRNDNGDSARDEDLQKAYANIVEGLTVLPTDEQGHKDLETVTWALVRRGQKPPAELKRRADFLAAASAQDEASKTSQLPESPRERFEFDAWEDKASRLRRYLGFGGFFIVVLWMYREFQEYRFTHRRDDEHEVLMREELHQLDSHRRRQR